MADGKGLLGSIAGIIKGAVGLGGQEKDESSKTEQYMQTEAEMGIPCQPKKMEELLPYARGRFLPHVVNMKLFRHLLWLKSTKPEQFNSSDDYVKLLKIFFVEQDLRYSNKLQKQFRWDEPWEGFAAQNSYHMEKLTELVATLPDGDLENPRVNEHQLNESSYMSTKFRAPPEIKAFITDKRFSLLEKIFACKGLRIAMPQNVVELKKMIDELESLLQVNKIISWEERKRNHKRKLKNSRFRDSCYLSDDGLLDKKNTFTAVYEPASDRSQMPKELQNEEFYAEAVKLLGVIRGRYRNYFSSGIRCLCARLDKTGWISEFITEEDLEKDLATTVFLLSCISEFSVRKAFTLDNQQQGSLPPMQQSILNDILRNSPTTNWNLVALVYPTDWVMKKCSRDFLLEWKNKWLTVVPFITEFLMDQWAKGVEARVEKDMVVPSSQSTEIDTEGWNMICGAWNNCVRQLRYLSTILNETSPAIYKCMKLTAHDQLQWAESDGQGVHKDLVAFKELVKQNISPWSAVVSPELDVESSVRTVCARLEVNSNAWFGRPKTRTMQEQKEHVDMVCGVALPVDKETADALKEMGIYKAKPAHKQKAESDGGGSSSDAKKTKDDPS